MTRRANQGQYSAIPKLDIEQQRSSIAALKLRGFIRILDAEEEFLPNSGGLIARLRRSIAALEARTAG